MRIIRLLKHDLRAEIHDWEAEGLIDSQQAQQFCARYGMDYEQDSGSFGYRVLLALGYLFVGLALIVLIGGNWDDIPRGLRMGTLIGLTVATQTLGLRLYVLDKLRSACGVFFLGNLFFGASIILIAQIYHLGEHMPDGVYWWAFGSLPFAVLTRSPWLMTVTLCLAAIWFFLELEYGFSTYPLIVFLVAAVYVLATGPRSLLLMLLTAVTSSVFIEVTLWRLIDDSRAANVLVIILPVSAAIGLLYWALSQWLNAQKSTTAKDYGVLLELWSLRFGVAFLILISFESVWRELYRWVHVHALINITCVILIAATAIFGVGANRTRTTLTAILVVVALFIAPAIAVYENIDIAMQIAVNLIAIIAGVRLIIRGLALGKSQHYFLGIILILGIAFLRYFDLIGSYVGGALVLGFFAFIMLASARYWRGREVNL